MKKISLILIIFAVFVLAASAAWAQEASFYLSPSHGNYKVGETFSVNVFINSEGIPINAAQGMVYFPKNLLNVTSILKSDSIFSLWFQEPAWSNSTGRVSFGGGLPSPGFQGRGGKVMTIKFKAVSAGQARISFSDEAILANDAKGTNVFSFSQGGNYSITAPGVAPPRPPSKRVPIAPEVYSPTHPEPEKWYSNNNPQFKWKLSSDITGLNLAFNQKSIFDPGNILRFQGLFTSKDFEEIEDGIWYFHLKFKNEIGWGKTTHFKIQIDTQPPHPFQITLDNEGDPTNPTPLLYFKTEDDMSGINYYQIEIGEENIIKVSSGEVDPFRMPLQTPGIRPIVVKAVDHAQNFIKSGIEVKIESIARPQITVCPGVFISGEEIMYIGGNALPDSQVIVFLEKDGKLIKKWETASNEKGEWFLIEDGLFRPGRYEISAKTKDNRGVISNSSDLCLIEIILSGLVIGPWIISYETLSLISIIILIIILIGILYLFLKIRKTKKTIKKESQDLKNKFYKEYNELKNDIEREIEILEKTRKGQETKEEKKRIEQLLKNLDDVKRVLKKELKDIEKLSE